ncbi:protein SLOW GREEN 1, chloroplastic-like [Primulina eburnea]|uniref:protein SLOW GREEN 1, chloroplastic-like n=1 Tax=Primulina eburnea TaxID=1245227 RepID=UPI003C6BD701
MAMATLNLTASKAPNIHDRLNPLRSSFSRSFLSLSFTIPPPTFPRLVHSTTKASFQPSNPEINPQKPTPRFPFILDLPPLKATLIAAIAAAALFGSQFYFALKPASTARVSPQITVESTEKDVVVNEERENFLEEKLISNPSDIDGLKDLLEIKIRSKKVSEAVGILEKLVQLEPEDVEWPTLKAHIYAGSGETELAKNGFLEVLKKDPLRVEAYHGLVTVASREESGEDLDNINERVEEAMKMCEKENKMSDMRDFKMLLAQIRLLEGRYDTALKVYQELVEEEPKDFRPYLCQGIIFTLLGNSNEAEKNFEEYRRLVPQGHPYASYFDDNVTATKIFAQKMEEEGAITKS